MKRQLLTAIFLIFLLPLSAFGKNYGAEILYDRVWVKFFPDGREILREEKAVKILDSRGVKEFGEVVIPFSTEHQKLKVLYAYTVTPDGRKVRPGKKAFNVVYPPFVSEAPIYSDLKYQTISMPAVAPGSVVKYAYQIETFKPYMKNNFWETNYFQDFYPVKEASFTVLVPDGHYYRYKAYHMKEKPHVEHQKNYTVLKWELRDVPPLDRERNMPPYGELAKKVAITSVRSWSEIARWYSDLSREAIEPDNLVRKTTLRITEGKKTLEEKIRAIYNFVAQNIRYVGMEFGINGYKPHRAGEVLRNRYGDCKDHATLLIAMLKVIGVKGYPVLIPTLSKANADPDLPMPTAFNHEIAAIKWKKGLLFLDTTSDYVPFGYLPPSDQGRNSLVVDVSKGDGKLVETPVYPPSSNVEGFRGRFSLSPFGGLKGEFTFNYTGVYGMMERARLSGMTPSQIKRHVEELASKLSPGFDVESFRLSDFKDLNLPYVRIEIRGRDGAYGTRTSHFLLAKFPSPDYSRIVSLVAARERKYPFVIGYKMEKVISSTLELPSGYTLYVRPENLFFKNRVGSLKLTWKLSGNRLTLNALMVLNRRVVPPEEYPDLRELFNYTVKTLRNQIVVLKRED